MSDIIARPLCLGDIRSAKATKDESALEKLQPLRSQRCINSKFSSSQCLGLGCAVRIQVRLLADTNRPVAESVPKTFVVKCGGVERASVIPDSWRILSEMPCPGKVICETYRCRWGFSTSASPGGHGSRGWCGRISSVARPTHSG